MARKEESPADHSEEEQTGSRMLLPLTALHPGLSGDVFLHTHVPHGSAMLSIVVAEIETCLYLVSASFQPPPEDAAEESDPDCWEFHLSTDQDLDAAEGDPPMLSIDIRDHRGDSRKWHMWFEKLETALDETESDLSADRVLH